VQLLPWPGALTRLLLVQYPLTIPNRALVALVGVINFLVGRAVSSVTHFVTELTARPTSGDARAPTAHFAALALGV